MSEEGVKSAKKIEKMSIRNKYIEGNHSKNYLAVKYQKYFYGRSNFSGAKEEILSESNCHII